MVPIRREWTRAIFDLMLVRVAERVEAFAIIEASVSISIEEKSK
jgi:hypothetical protein